MMINSDEISILNHSYLLEKVTGRSRAQKVRLHRPKEASKSERLRYILTARKEHNIYLVKYISGTGLAWQKKTLNVYACIWSTPLLCCAFALNSGSVKKYAGSSTSAQAVNQILGIFLVARDKKSRFPPCSSTN